MFCITCNTYHPSYTLRSSPKIGSEIKSWCSRMCCGIAIAAGALAGVGAFFSVAAIASQLGASSSAMDLAAQWATPLDGTAFANGAQKLMLPEITSALGAVSGGVLLVEHLLFLLLGAWWSIRRLRAWADPPQQQQQPLAALQQLQALSDEIRSRAGPASVMHWEDVRPAPAATMEVGGLADGEAAAHVDGRGAIYRFKLRGAEGVYVNMYHTTAGHMRSGDLHEHNQYDVRKACFFERGWGGKMGLEGGGGFGCSGLLNARVAAFCCCAFVSPQHPTACVQHHQVVLKGRVRLTMKVRAALRCSQCHGCVPCNTQPRL